MVLISPELSWEMLEATGISCEITVKRPGEGEGEAAKPVA